jgi:hypothetical protein
MSGKNIETVKMSGIKFINSYATIKGSTKSMVGLLFDNTVDFAIEDSDRK